MALTLERSPDLPNKPGSGAGAGYEKDVQASNEAQDKLADQAPSHSKEQQYTDARMGPWKLLAWYLILLRSHLGHISIYSPDCGVLPSNSAPQVTSLSSSTGDRAMQLCPLCRHPDETVSRLVSDLALLKADMVPSSTSFAILRFLMTIPSILPS